MILISGASGLVGRTLSYFLENKNIPYIGTYNSNKIEKENMFKVNYLNPEEMEIFLREKKISICIFCVVQRLTDICEKNWEEIKKINIDIVYNSSYVCNKLGIKFIHLSTDYVFDGLKQPNFPNSIKNPLQNYGISKLISEYRVINNCKNYVIVRTPVLYSNLSKIHDNAVMLIGKNLMDLREDSIFKEDDYSIRRPLYIPDLCQFILNCLDIKYQGIYHFYNPYNKFTKYQICQKIAKVLQVDTKKIIPTKKSGLGIAPRPYDTNLADKRINIDDYIFNDFDQTIYQCFEKLKFITIDKEKSKDFFILIDLDGTLINSNDCHYNSYKRVFQIEGFTDLTKDKWNNIIDKNNFNKYLQDNFSEEKVKNIKKKKLEELKKEKINYTKNSDIFINYLIDNNFNFCIVTNTNKETVEIFKTKLSLLNKIKNWICREDYSLQKPNSDCYHLAMKKFYNREKYIIGIEDTEAGYNSLKNVTNNIYIYNNNYLFKKEDCYLFNNFKTIFK